MCLDSATLDLLLTPLPKTKLWLTRSSPMISPQNSRPCWGLRLLNIRRARGSRRASYAHRKPSAERGQGAVAACLLNPGACICYGRFFVYCCRRPQRESRTCTRCALPSCHANKYDQEISNGSLCSPRWSFAYPYLTPYQGLSDGGRRLWAPWESVSARRRPVPWTERGVW